MERVYCTSTIERIAKTWLHRLGTRSLIKSCAKIWAKILDRIALEGWKLLILIIVCLTIAQFYICQDLINKWLIIVGRSSCSFLEPHVKWKAIVAVWIWNNTGQRLRNHSIMIHMMISNSYSVPLEVRSSTTTFNGISKRWVRTLVENLLDSFLKVVEINDKKQTLREKHPILSRFPIMNRLAWPAERSKVLPCISSSPIEIHARKIMKNLNGKTQAPQYGQNYITYLGPATENKSGPLLFLSASCT